MREVVDFRKKLGTFTKNINESETSGHFNCDSNIDQDSTLRIIKVYQDDI